MNYLCECEGAASNENCKTEFSKTLMRPGDVHGQNEHNHVNKIVSGKELCEFYCLGLHKRLNNSGYRVH